MAIRKNFVIGMIGANGTGKTTITKEMVVDWRNTRPNFAVVGFDPHRQLGGLIDFHINPDDKEWAVHVWKKSKNTLQVWDDYKGLVPFYVPTLGMRQIFIDRRHNNTDIIYSCHSPGNVIDMMTEYTTHYYIFHTKNIEGKFKDKMPNAELCIAASRAVNKYVSMHGLGKHKLDPAFNLPPNNGQGFPYIIVEAIH